MFRKHLDIHETRHSFPQNWTSKEIYSSLHSYSELSFDDLETLKNVLKEHLNNKHIPISLIQNEHKYRDLLWYPSWFLYTKTSNNNLLIWLFDKGIFLEWIICYSTNPEWKIYEIWKFDEDGTLTEWKIIYPKNIIIDANELRKYIETTNKKHTNHSNKKIF